jgi:hypothetical protein
MSLVNVTPSVNWDLDCNIEDCDGYACDVHGDYAEIGCDINGCDSAISTYLVEIDGYLNSICQYHYSTLKVGN